MAMCPWMKMECAGEEECAPAVLSPKRDEHGDLKPFCPIVSGVEAFEYIAMVIAPILEEAGIVRKPPPDPTKDREEWIKNKVKPDQET